MRKLTLTAGFCLIIASLGVPGLARNLPVYKTGDGNPCYGRQDGRYPNPNDRYSYYNCVWGYTYIQKCPENLVYRHSIAACYYPGVAVTSNTSHEIPCKAGHTTKPTLTTSSPPATPIKTTTGSYLPGNLCTGRPDGQYTNPNDQHSFLSCVAGLTYILQCPANLVYVQAINACDYPSSPTTIGPSITTSSPPATPIKTTTGSYFPGNLCTGRPDGQYTNPNDQHSFLSCVAGLTYILQCPANLVYVQAINACDYPSSPTTIGPSITTSSPPATPIKTTSGSYFPGNLCTGRPDGQYTNPNDQHSFLSCVAGLTYILQCPANLVYVQAINACDYPSSPTTNGPPITTTSPPTTTPLTTTSPPPTPIKTTTTTTTTTTTGSYFPGNLCTGRPDGQYTNPNDPHSFLSCVAGLTYILQCPENLVYVQASNSCENP
ncbi:uncharacterized protein AB9W97_018879 [Spinachia spinachia]